LRKTMLSTEPSSVGIQNYSIQQVQDQKFPSILAQLLESVEFVPYISLRHYPSCLYTTLVAGELCSVLFQANRAVLIFTPERVTEQSL
jgi:hypothetical protein